MRYRCLLFIAIIVTFASCQQVSTDEARRLVEQYNRVVCEAYRRSDIKLIDSVVGPNSRDGRNLTGLIGVRFDMGITLDAELLSLEVTGVEQSNDELRVRTKERWRYRDLRIGSGNQVGEESLDSYEMLYIFKRIKQAWMVEETRFTAPPQVGRKTTPWQADHRLLHGIAKPDTNRKTEGP